MNSEKIKEIKKALECCQGKTPNCANCSYWCSCKKDYGVKIRSEILALINELESENKRLLEQRNKTYNIWVKDTEKLKNRIAELEKENDSLKKQLIAIDTLDETNFEKRHNAIVFITEKQLKQFAERLKEKSNNKNAFICSNSITATEIDETLKEFIK